MKNTSTTNQTNDIFQHVLSFSSTTLNSGAAYRDVNSTGSVDLESSSYTTLYRHGNDVNSSKMLLLLAVVLPISALALISSIGACCVGCRANKTVPILPQSISFHRTKSSDMHSEINLTSVTYPSFSNYTVSFGIFHTFVGRQFESRRGGDPHL